ncbi:E3 ubiquitin-protein ligase KCMF1 [Drosophila elegans]|uniref:E3 ubiquitin-protein ligase KCMF1 n=1 Tax=Drosophila elegans TaxID=30023 RepID=UPI0007E7AC51|nr:E3 ubiquitin-protein ligase KCMF1 [Drosophila elegans]
MAGRHICCDGCQRQDFRGRRFRCMRCVNYDLCGDCYDQRIETQQHRCDHPMQLILESQDGRPLLGGDVPDLVHLSNCYSCPYCNQLGHSAKRLIEHVCGQHRLADTYVVCPMCAGLPAIHLVAIRNLARHLLLNHIEHANLLEPDTPPLRRILVRSRIRRRRQLQQQQGYPQPQTRGFDMILQLGRVPGHSDLQMPTIDLTGETNKQEVRQVRSPAIVAPPKRQSERHLLLQWIAQQELRCQETEATGSLRRRHGLFVDHLLASMLCCEELQLPEKDAITGSGRDRDQHGLSKVMSLMSLPWTRAWQATQQGGSQGEGKSQDASRDQTDLGDGREPQTEQEKADTEEAID